MTKVVRSALLVSDVIYLDLIIKQDDGLNKTFGINISKTKGDTKKI